MSRATFFIQECPTCGRQLHVRIEYLGKSVHCQHCDAQFLAITQRPVESVPHASLMDRANALLESADASGEAQKQRPR